MKRYRSGLAIVLALAVVGSGPGPVAPVVAAGPTGVAPTAATVPASQPASTLATTRSIDGPVSSATSPSLAQMVGQKLVIVMAGHKPDANLLGRVRRGEIGGIVLLGSNITTRAALIRLTGKLQAAAAAGGQPPLLIAIDQEGGFVKRIPWAPPTITVPEMGRMGSNAVARRQGAKTGAALRRLGINVDFAPVADIPRSTASFMYQQGRTFSFDPVLTARLANAFAAGLASAGVLATMKHFPGIGLAKKNTDLFVDTIRASKAKLNADLRPYRKAVGRGIGLIMLSNATYTAYDSGNAAGWSSAIAGSLLRHDLGFAGVTITDSLSGTANARGLKVKVLALRAAIAGTDMILMTGSEKSSRGLYAALLADAGAGSIPAATLRASYDRILALKARF